MNLGSEQAVEAMLSSVGLSPEDLFSDVPDRFHRALEIPPGRSDLEVEQDVRSELSRNVPLSERPGLLGGGAYAHWVPPETRYLATRGEFLTAYTPYQSEINQGLLTALFEFQTLTARLLDLEVANTGVYDGASGAGEACLMALRVKRRAKTVLVPDHLPVQRRSIIENYILGAGGRLVDVPTDPQTGTLDTGALAALLVEHEVACVHVEYPNAYGCIEPMTEIGELAHDAGALFTCLVPEVTALGLLHGPGHHGVDIAAAEGQPMALPPSFGGPALGLFATTETLLRKMPGRIVGQTEDAKGRTSFCLTLQTREQHIRRARATSNICTNQSFLSVLFTTTLATLGESGFQRMARTNASRTRELMDRLAEAGATVHHQATPHYNEFLFDPPGEPAAFVQACRDAQVQPGLPAKRLFGQDAQGLIACVTETVPDWALDAVVASCKEVA